MTVHGLSAPAQYDAENQTLVLAGTCSASAAAAGIHHASVVVGAYLGCSLESQARGPNLLGFHQHWSLTNLVSLFEVAPAAGADLAVRCSYTL